MKTTEVEFELTGITPLLMHADDVEAADTLKEWRKDPSNKSLSVAGDDRSPAWTWQTYLYQDGAHVAMPAENIMVCLRTAGVQIILKRQKTFKEITQSGLLIMDEFCDFFVGDKLDQKVRVAPIQELAESPFKEQSDYCRGDLGFRLFVKRARVGTSKHVRVRPRFDQWRVRGRMKILAKEITFQKLQQLFDIAGRIGLCDWRPGCKTPGSFGMFSAKVKKV